MKPADVNSSPYIDFNKENNNDQPKFKVGDHARISEYKKCFAKGFVPNWSQEVFVIKKLKILCHRHTLLVISTVKKLLELLRKSIAKK